jgi:hypothetical protein
MQITDSVNIAIKKNHHYLFMGYRSGYLNCNPLCQKKTPCWTRPASQKKHPSFSGIVGIKAMSAAQRSRFPQPKDESRKQEEGQ